VGEAAFATKRIREKEMETTFATKRIREKEMETTFATKRIREKEMKITFATKRIRDYYYKFIPLVAQICPKNCIYPYSLSSTDLSKKLYLPLFP